MNTIWREIRFAVRSFGRSPAFTTAALLSLALGIGANTTIFTLLNAVFLNPLPVARASELVAVYTVDSNTPGGFGGLLQTSRPNFLDYRDRNHVLAGMAAYSFPVQVSVFHGTTAEQALAEMVTANFFDLLGVRLPLGRAFRDEEDATPLAHPVAVLSHGYWTRRLGGDPNVIGRTLAINGQPYTVIGVAPEGFKGINALVSPDLWVPTMMWSRIVPAQFADWFESRRALAFSIAARLQPGVTMAQAEAELKTIGRALESAYPVENKGRSVTLRPLAQATIFPGLRGTLVLGSLVLVSVVALVLLVACSNVANLLVARGLARRQELAVRTALGASRRQLVRQLLTESLLLALGGGLAGLGIAALARDGLWSLRPPFVAQNFVELALDWRVFAFTLLLSLVTGLLFGLLPALQASRADVVDALKEETRTAGRSRRRLRVGNTLVVAQVALSVVALAAAGLFVRSLQQAYAIDPGFDTRHTAAVFVNPGQAGYSQARAETFYREVEERLRARPGVAGVAWNSTAPLTGGFLRTVIPEGQEADTSRRLFAVANTCTPGYFAVMGTPLRRGRDFTEADRAGTLPVAVVNETLASRVWPGEDALGRRFRFIGDDRLYTIVGVVATTKYTTLGEEPAPAVFVPLAQQYSDAMVLFVRSAGDPSAALGRALDLVRGIDPQIPLVNPSTMADVLGQSLWAARMGAILLGALGLLALVLASVGLYGVLTYSVGQRQHEIGLRMALGAGRSDVMGLVLREGMTLVGVGLVLGLAGALAVSRVVAGLLYGITPTDVPTFGGVSLVLVIVALVACGVPAFRASRLDPVVALR